MSNSEIWKPMPSFPGYEASSLGRVRSVDRVIICKNGTRRPIKGKILSPGMHSIWHPYPQYNINKKSVRAHDAVMDAFVGPKPPGMQVRHLNGEEENNTKENLVYGTPKENQDDRMFHRTAETGEFHSQAKLNLDKVREIRKRLANGEKQSCLAAEFRVTQPAISLIKNGKTWDEQNLCY